jgi:hypothetical protein
MLLRTQTLEGVPEAKQQIERQLLLLRTRRTVCTNAVAIARRVAMERDKLHPHWYKPMIADVLTAEARVWGIAGQFAFVYLKAAASRGLATSTLNLYCSLLPPRDHVTGQPGRLRRY